MRSELECKHYGQVLACSSDARSVTLTRTFGTTIVVEPASSGTKNFSFV